jgi:quercetin dioxygenase-like cupin family protein
MRKILALMLVLALGMILGALSTQTLRAASQPVTRVTLVKAEKLQNLPGMDGYVMYVTIAPGAQSGWHVHPGHELSQILDGEGTLDVSGEPRLAIKKGVGVHINPMVPHNAINTSKTAPLHVAVVYVLESGKPVASPVPAPTQ